MSADFKDSYREPNNVWYSYSFLFFTSRLLCVCPFQKMWSLLASHLNILWNPTLKKSARVPVWERRRSPVAIGKCLSRHRASGLQKRDKRSLRKVRFAGEFRITSVPLLSGISRIFDGSWLIRSASRSTTNKPRIPLYMSHVEPSGWHFPC